MDSAYNQVMPIHAGSEVDHFLHRTANFFSWDSLNEMVVMDIGCGVGNTSKLLLEKFPGVYKIIGIDQISEYIDIARKENPHPKIDYQVADITDSQIINRWGKSVNKAISVFCFNYIKDLRTAYQNLFDILAYEGEAAIYLTLHSGYYDFVMEIYEDPMWAQFTKGKKLLIPEGHKLGLDHLYHTELLQDIGFELVFSKIETKMHRYPSEKDFRHLIALSCPQAPNVPTELLPEFRQHAFATFMKHNSKDEYDIPFVEHKVVSIFAKRPWKTLFESPLKLDSPIKRSNINARSPDHKTKRATSRDKLKWISFVDYINGSASANPRNGSASANPRNGSFFADLRNGNFSADPRNGSISADPRNGSISADPRNGSVSADSKNGSVSADRRNGCASADPKNGCASTDPKNGCASADPRYDCASADPWPSSASAHPWHHSASADPWPGSASADPWPGSASADPWPGSASADPWPGSASADPWPGSASAAPRPGSAPTDARHGSASPDIITARRNLWN